MLLLANCTEQPRAILRRKASTAGQLVSYLHMHSGLPFSLGPLRLFCKDTAIV